MGGNISGRTHVCPLQNFQEGGGGIYDCLGEQLSGIYCMFGQGFVTVGLKTQSYTLAWLTEPS